MVTFYEKVRNRNPNTFMIPFPQEEMKAGKFKVGDKIRVTVEKVD